MTIKVRLHRRNAEPIEIELGVEQSEKDVYLRGMVKNSITLDTIELVVYETYRQELPVGLQIVNANHHVNCFDSTESKKEEKMNDHIDQADGLVQLVPAVAAEAATLVPVLAEADGVLVGAGALPGDEVDAGEVIGYIQTDEDA